MAKSFKKEVKEQTIYTACRIPESLLNKAREKAKKERRTVSFIIVEALEKSMNKKAA